MTGSYDAVKDIVSSLVKQKPKSVLQEGLSFAIVQSDPKVDLSIKRNMAAEDRLFVRHSLSKITEFFVDQIEAIGFMQNTKDMVVVTCYDFKTHGGGNCDAQEFSKEIKRLRPDARVFVYDKSRRVSPDDIKGGIIDGVIRTNHVEADDHSGLLQFLRNHLVDWRIAQLEETLRRRRS